MNACPCLVVEVRTLDEPAAHLSALWAGVRQLVGALGAEPQRLWTTSPGGRSGKERAFSWQTAEAFGNDESTGTVSAMGLREHANDLSVSLYLRHNPKLQRDSQPPAALWLSVETTPDWPDVARVAAAADDFLVHCAAQMPVLHGGVTMLANMAQAWSEVTGTSTDIEKQPAAFQMRREGDFLGNKLRLRERCRRLYSTTLLGPELARAVGGATAARAAGAVHVHEVAGSLVLRAMDGPPLDSLDLTFLMATKRLRRWLWPHTFQNPVDAAGFEDQVGVARPSPDA